jgi:hypothetical protein
MRSGFALGSKGRGRRATEAVHRVDWLASCYQGVGVGAPIAADSGGAPSRSDCGRGGRVGRGTQPGTAGAWPPGAPTPVDLLRLPTRRTLSVGSAVLGDNRADVRVPVDLSEFEAALPAMAVGCGLFGGDRVTQVAALGTPLEP